MGCRQQTYLGDADRRAQNNSAYFLYAVASVSLPFLLLVAYILVSMVTSPNTMSSTSTVTSTATSQVKEAQKGTNTEADPATQLDLREHCEEAYRA